MRVIVTGATGFIGSHCLRMLRAHGHEAVGFVRPLSSSPRLADLELEFRLLPVDLLDRDAVLGALRDITPDAVIHAAWYSAPRLYLHDVDRNIESLQAGLAVLRAAIEARVDRLVFVGSCLEGIAGGADSIYAETKRCLHEVALSPAVQAEAAVVCAHLFSPYGPDEHPSRAVPSVIQSLLQGEPIAVTAGDSRRDYVHITDVSSALLLLAESRLRGSVDLCTGHSVQMKEVFTVIAGQIQSPDLLKWGHAEVRPGECFDAVGDPAAMIALGWLPQFDLANGIRDAVEWWRWQLADTGGRS